MLSEVDTVVTGEHERLRTRNQCSSIVHGTYRFTTAELSLSALESRQRHDNETRRALLRAGCLRDSRNSSRLGAVLLLVADVADSGNRGHARPCHWVFDLHASFNHHASKHSSKRVRPPSFPPGLVQN